jgi:hypothetical protein
MEKNGMSDRSEEIKYLRAKARQFRDLAITHRTGISDHLLKIAAEFDSRADHLAKETGK